MLKAQAEISSKKINNEITSLNPSTLIQMFEIDLSSLTFNKGLIGLSEEQKIFRFHNNVKLLNTSIFWQGNRYIAAPINAEGFEFSSKGVIPTPKLSLTTNENGINAITIFKQTMRQLGDIVGAKVSRLRTFAKYLDAANFYAVDSNGNAILDQPIDRDLIPVGFAPDSYAEFPRDVYYVDRKSIESKTSYEFELASILDIKDVKLPGRVVLANRCPFTYRGHGCFFEYEANRTSIHENGTLPNMAPVTATVNGEKISDILGRNPVYRGQFDNRKSYSLGDAVWIERDQIKYYFVAKTPVINQPPPNTNFWIQEGCGKSPSDCRLRYGINGSVIVGSADNTKIARGRLMYGGFPAVIRLNQ